MSMYVENNLSNDENIVLKAKKNPLYLLIPGLWMVIFLVIASVLTGLYGTHFYSYNETACRVVIEQRLEEGFDKETAEEQDYTLEMYDVDSRSELKEKMFKEMWGPYGDVGNSSLASAFISQMLKAADISEGTVIVQMIMPIVSYVGWFAFAIAALVFLKKLCRFVSFDLALTNKRVVGKTGLLHANVIDIHIDKVDNIQIKSSVFGNLMKYYSIRVKAASNEAGSKNNDFVGVKNAQEFKDRTNEVIEQHAERARRAQAEEIARAMKN